VKIHKRKDNFGTIKILNYIVLYCLLFHRGSFVLRFEFVLKVVLLLLL